jgi:hypothetical protein
MARQARQYRIMDHRKELMNVSMAARALCVSRRTLARAIERHEVDTVTFGGFTWVPACEVRRLLGQFTGEPQAAALLTMEDLLTRAHQ